MDNIGAAVNELLKEIYAKDPDIVSFIAKEDQFISFVENNSYDSPSSITVISNKFPQILSGQLCTLVYGLYGIVDANDADIDENIIMNPDQRTHFREVAAKSMR